MYLACLSPSLYVACLRPAPQVMNMKFEEDPDYPRLMAMFEPIVNNVQRPLCIDSALKVRSSAGASRAGPAAQRHSLQLAVTCIG